MRKLCVNLSLTLTLALATCLGCSPSGDRATAPVTGKVSYKGKTLNQGTVMFVPDDGGPAATGEINADGEYTLGTYGTSDGAVLGKHKVSITALEDMAGALPEQRSGTPKPLVPQKYLNHEKSGLTFEVKDDDNVADFELTD